VQCFWAHFDVRHVATAAFFFTRLQGMTVAHEG
jgi:hypothetical protein